MVWWNVLQTKLPRGRMWAVSDRAWWHSFKFVAFQSKALSSWIKDGREQAYWYRSSRRAGVSGSGFECRLQVFRGAGKGAGTHECWSGVSDLRTWGCRCGLGWGWFVPVMVLGRKCSGGDVFSSFGFFRILLLRSLSCHTLTSAGDALISRSEAWAWECLSLFWCSGGWGGKTDLVLVCLQIIK